jgi:tetratricopeptide (TPR) repeat protein/TolB-like protein
MAPEQAAADEAIDHRADLYAVGAMAYELLTGRPPFTAGTPQQVLAAQVMEAPQPVTELRASVPPALETLIMRCLEKKPADRWQSAEEMLPHLEAAVTPSGGITPTDMQPVTAPAPPTRRSWRPWMAGAALVAVVALGIWVSAPSGGPDLDPRVVAVMPFENLTGDESLDHVGRMASMNITQALEKTRLVMTRTFETAWSAAVFIQAEIERGAVSDKLRAFASEVESGTIIHGGYSLDAGQLRLDASVTDVASGTLLRSVEPVTGDPASPMQVVEALQPKIMGAMAMEFDSALAPYVGQVVYAPTDEAAREFAQGAELYLTEQRYAEARDHFLRAHELDPNFATPLIYAAWAQGNLRHREGGRPLWDSIWAAAEMHREHLTPYEILLLDAWQAGLQGDRRSLIDGLEKACDLAPGEKACYNLGQYLVVYTNQPSRAVDVLSERLEPEKGWIRGWFPYWAMLVYSSHVAGDHAGALDLIEEARNYYPGRFDLAIYESFVLIGLGRIGDLFSFLEEAPFSFPNQDIAYYARLAGCALEHRGYHEDAVRAWDYSADVYEVRLAENPESRANLRGIAETLWLLGRLDEADDHLRRSAELRPGRIPDIAGMGLFAATRGDSEEARRIMTWLDAQEGASPETLLVWKAKIAGALGEKDQAVAYLREKWNHPNFYGFGFLDRVECFPSLYGYPPYEELYWPEGR